VHKAYKFRVYPTKTKKNKMDLTLNLCRWVYDQTLALRKNTWENESKPVSKHDTNALLPTRKKDKPDLQEVFSQVLQNIQARVDLALKAFFRRVKVGEGPGYPRFRDRNRYDSFTYPQFGFSLKSGKLHISKIGDIKIKVHRAIEGTIKTCTIRWMPTGEWFACFSVETYVPPPPRRDGPVVGIDVGLESFATLSNGEKIDNPRFFRSE